MLEEIGFNFKVTKVNIDKGEWSLARAISNSRLVITNYNGSTYQETLSANIPTIIYWDINLTQLS